MTSKNPLITIGIPTYNRANLLNNAIKSAVNQSYKDIEIVISNNCSTDNTISILDSFASNNKIKIFNQKSNIGVVNNWNFCLKKAKGDFFLMLSDDDELNENCIKELFEGIKRGNSIACLGKANKSTSKNNFQDKILNNNYEVIHGDSFIKKCLSYSLVAYPSALLFNRKLAIENGCYPEIGTSTDFALVINLSSNNYISVLNKYVCYYRVHEESISRSIESIKNYQSYLDWSFKNPKIDSKIKILIKKYVLDQIFLFALRNVLRGNIEFYNYSRTTLNNYSKNLLKNIILNLANTRFARFIYNLRKSL